MGRTWVGVLWSVLVIHLDTTEATLHGTGRGVIPAALLEVASLGPSPTARRCQWPSVTLDLTVERIVSTPCVGYVYAGLDHPVLVAALTGLPEMCANMLRTVYWLAALPSGPARSAGVW